MILGSFFIIEQDIEIIEKIEGIMTEFPNFSNFGFSFKSSEAMNIILQKKPNLVFINIDDAIENAWSFVSETEHYLEEVPGFIALSSSKEKAYDALKNNFIDFLLKPASELDIRKAILKFKKKHSFKPKDTLCLKSYKDYQYISTDDILFLKADNNTTDFHLSNGKTISAFKTLKTFEDILPENFMRVHKSYIVNMHHVIRVNYGNLRCTVKESDEFIPFTRTYIRNIDNLNRQLSQTSILNLN